MPKGVYPRTDKMRRNISIAKKGKRLSEGIIPWNRGVPYSEGRSAWNKGVSEGQGNRWKGDNVSYSGLHSWVRKHLGSAYICSQCESKKWVEWANISGEYKRELTDYLQLCRSCHHKFDDISSKRQRNSEGRFI